MLFWRLMDEEDSFRLRPPEQAFAAKDDRLISEKTGPEKGRRSPGCRQGDASCNKADLLFRQQAYI